MVSAKLNLGERELLSSYENGEFVSDITEERKEQLSSVLHKYVSGGFKDISANKPIQRTPLTGRR